MTAANWKPDRAEAQFLGELVNLKPDLATIARDMLAKGQPLDSVVRTFKSALAVASLMQGAARG